MLVLLLLRFIPISDPGPGCSARAWAGQKVTARLAKRSAGVTPKGRWEDGGLVSQCQSAYETTRR